MWASISQCSSAAGWPRRCFERLGDEGTGGANELHCTRHPVESEWNPQYQLTPGQRHPSRASCCSATQTSQAMCGATPSAPQSRRDAGSRGTWCSCTGHLDRCGGSGPVAGWPRLRLGATGAAELEEVVSTSFTSENLLYQGTPVGSKASQPVPPNAGNDLPVCK